MFKVGIIALEQTVKKSSAKNLTGNLTQLLMYMNILKVETCAFIDVFSDQNWTSQKAGSIIVEAFQNVLKDAKGNIQKVG